jgi:hypothetical protein
MKPAISPRMIQLIRPCASLLSDVEQWGDRQEALSLEASDKCSRQERYCGGNPDIAGGAVGSTSDTLGLAALGAGESAAQITSDHTLFSAALSALGVSTGC